jgi:hypothetical protein
MKERARELKTAARRGPRVDKADGESDVLAKIAEMPEPDRALAERLHALIKGCCAFPHGENLVRNARVRQGRQGRLLFQAADKFKARYAAFGFSRCVTKSPTARDCRVDEAIEFG